MRYKKMPADAQRALARKLDYPKFNRAVWHAEEQIEARRKRAIRASWLDLRSPAARRERANALATYNVALRTHIVRIHEVTPPFDPWELDAFHEELHGRG